MLGAMVFDRRQILGAFGAASASTLLWALGCGSQLPTVRRAPQVSGEVRTWLHDAVERLAAHYPTVHALAVSRQRTTAALDVAGTGLARTRRDGAVLTVRERDGIRREYVTSELTADGIAAAVTALASSQRRRTLDFGRAPELPAESPPLDERDLRHRVERLQRDATPSSRIIYAAALLDIDDTVVWSVAPGRDLEQRLVRSRQVATRAAWNGNRASLATVERAWSGWLDDHPFTDDDLAAASAAALELMTPGDFPTGEYTVVLDPSAAALVIETVTRTLLTAGASAAAARDSQLASPLVTLTDDPTTAGAYGHFAFDDEGEPAAPLTLLDHGRVAAHLTDHAHGGAGRGRRPGHLALVEPAPSHLVLAPGATAATALYGDGFLLERGVAIAFDPATDHLRLACARARELKAGNPTGRVYADVELVAPITTFLSTIDGVADTAAQLTPLAEPPTTDADPTDALGHASNAALWRSIAAPAVRARGLVRPRRGRA